MLDLISSWLLWSAAKMHMLQRTRYRRMTLPKAVEECKTAKSAAKPPCSLRHVFGPLAIPMFSYELWHLLPIGCYAGEKRGVGPDKHLEILVARDVPYHPRAILADDIS